MEVERIINRDGLYFKIVGGDSNHETYFSPERLSNFSLTEGCQASLYLLSVEYKPRWFSVRISFRKENKTTLFSDLAFNKILTEDDLNLTFVRVRDFVNWSGNVSWFLSNILSSCGILSKENDLLKFSCDNYSGELTIPEEYLKYFVPKEPPE